MSIGTAEVPANVPNVVAAIGPLVATLIVAALHEDPAARTLLVEDVSLDVFAADPFIADVVDPDTGDLGRVVIEALFRLVDS